MDSSQRTKDKTPVKEELVKSEVESSDEDSFEGTPHQFSDSDSEEPLKKQEKRLENLIHLYSQAKGRTRGFLPSFYCPMGQSFEYLTGIAAGVFFVPRAKEVKEVMLPTAPSDAALFEMLKTACRTCRIPE